MEITKQKYENGDTNWKYPLNNRIYGQWSILQMIYLLKWTMFNSCVVLPDGQKCARLEDPKNGFETP